MKQSKSTNHRKKIGLTFFNLPAELRCLILCQLSLSDLAKCCCVSKKFQTVACHDSLWRHLYFQRWASSSCASFAASSSHTSWKAAFQHRLITSLGKGIELFNECPNQGIAYLIEEKRLPRCDDIGLARQPITAASSSSVVAAATKDPPSTSTEQVAKFLFFQRGLDPRKIGQFLGELSTTYAFRLAFFSHLCLRDISLAEGLRRLFSKIAMPPTSKGIDRILWSYSESYQAQNKHTTPLRSTDAAYIVSFGCILLSTDLHKKNIKRKMSRKRFVRLFTSQQVMQGIPSTYWANLYNSIKKSPVDNLPLCHRPVSKGKVSVMSGRKSVSEALKKLQKNRR
mmetsp:Transcript_1692/g.2361  ORF Transcript_1692/g.2361 Transcript_1692/m.2361 type:complete len:340 (+) Transcript_1692:92-1111(+)